MPTQKTEITYDQSQAERELKKLDGNVKKSTRTVRREFKKADQDIQNLRKSLKKTSSGGGGFAGLTAGAGRFGDALGRISPKAAGAVSSVGRLVGSGGLIATGFAAAGAAVLATIANVVNLAGALADIDARLQIINQTADRTLKIRDEASAVGDAIENRRQEEARRAVKRQQAALGFVQNQLERERNAANERINIRKAEFREIDAAFKQSVRNRQTAEERLKDKLREIAGTQRIGSNQTQAGQVGELTAAATAAARSGDTETAEALLDRAKALSDELGNHVFFTNQIEKAQKAVVKALEQDVREAKNKESSLAKERGEITKNVAAAEKFKKVLDEQLKSILRQNRALASTRKLIGDSARAQVDVQDQEQGQRRVETGIGKLRDVSESVGGQADLGQFRDNFARILRAFKDSTNASSIQGGIKSIDAIGAKIATALETALADDGAISAREAQELAKATAGVSQAIGLLEQGIADNTESEALKTDVERIKSLFSGLADIRLGATQAARGGLDPDTGITPENVAKSRQKLERIIERREATINITNKIEGGMIDNATIKRLTEQISREIRKQTQKEN